MPSCLCSFPFGVWYRTWNSTISVPDHCFCLHFTVRGYLDLLNPINNIGKKKNDTFTISKAAKFKKNCNFCNIIDIEDTKLIEIMVKPPLIYCNSIHALFYFSIKAKKKKKKKTNK